MSIDQITEGFYKKLLNKENELKESRMKICKECKLYKEDGIFGPICNDRLYLDPITDETSTVSRNGFNKGCGCVLDAKTRVTNAKCPNNKW